jgi:hypothetical protein
MANKLQLAFTDLGVRQLKNISRRIQLYRVEERQPVQDASDRSVRRGPEGVYRDSYLEQSVGTLLAVELAEPEERANGTATSRWGDVVDDVASDVLPVYGAGSSDHGA